MSTGLAVKDGSLFDGKSKGVLMSKRVDTASQLIRASAATVYEAFATAQAMESWLPPEGMSATMLSFAFREGGGYRLRLTYNQPQHSPGKTSENADEVEVRFVKLAPESRIEQAVTFASDDPAFGGEMRMSWVLESRAEGTLATVRCENVPEGIRPEDHQAGLTSTLENLAAYVESSRSH
jgi:uncharacterized protein YndB with AHSA1/START domain